MESKLSILIVEDEALIAENLRLTLEDLGYQVPEACYTYAEAMEAFQRLPPDLVMLDINLSSADPAQDGLALGKYLAEHTDLPFIFLTAYNDLDTIRQATGLAPSGYLIKPVNMATLFAAVQTALANAGSRTTAALPTPEMQTQALPEYFFVKVGQRTHKLLWNDVVSMEAGKNYVTLRTADPTRGYPLRSSLSYVVDNLVPEHLRNNFVRASRSLVLNSALITSFDQNYVYCGALRFERGQISSQVLEGAR